MAETSPPPPTRRFHAVPIEETVKKVRRFAPEPVETTARSSKKINEQRSNDTNGEQKENAGKKRHVPTPVETTFKSSKLRTGNDCPTREPAPSSGPRSPSPETPKPRRRFAPELIETTRRSKRAGDVRPATLPTDKTDLTPGVPNIYTRKKKPAVPPAEGLLSATLPLIPPRRQPSMRPHLNTRRSTRQNSFQPDLEDIRSEENTSQENSEDERRSNGDSPPSLIDSIGSSEESLMRLQLARTRESCDERFSGYLLELAAKAAEKQLREQALAAFPNESRHEIVEHFYDRETSDDDSVEGIGMLIDDPMIPGIRRKSTEVGWAVKEMQEHQEKLNRLREEETHHKIAAEATNPTFHDPFWTNGKTDKSPFAVFARPDASDKEAELRCMRTAASPPMLGGDLLFRMCPSPKATKFESDQRIDVAPHRSETGGGLWGGYCVTAQAGEYLSPAINKGPTLIQTPHSEREDPFSSAFGNEAPRVGQGTRTPRSPRDSGVRMLAGIDERLKAEVERSKAEDALLEEFDDEFVTQVYNYLSLGYPVLARQYDEELAKISSIPEDELRSDDAKRDAKGYINISVAFPNGKENNTPEKKGLHSPGKGYCARWKALRLYILEWAKQHPSLSEGGATPIAWGVRARRGSWAI